MLISFLNLIDAIDPIIEKIANNPNTNLCPSIPGLLSNNDPIKGPINISGV